MKELFQTKVSDMTKKQFAAYCATLGALLAAVVFVATCCKQVSASEALKLGQNFFNAVCFAVPMAAMFACLNEFKRRGAKQFC